MCGFPAPFAYFFLGSSLFSSFLPNIVEVHIFPVFIDDAFFKDLVISVFLLPPSFQSFYYLFSTEVFSQVKKVLLFKAGKFASFLYELDEELIYPLSLFFNPQNSKTLRPEIILAHVSVFFLVFRNWIPDLLSLHFLGQKCVLLNFKFCEAGERSGRETRRSAAGRGAMVPPREDPALSLRRVEGGKEWGSAPRHPPHRCPRGSAPTPCGSATATWRPRGPRRVCGLWVFPL